ncbi:MAG TPA: cation:proton antiporter [Candidatus Binatia bacterium]|nr:cation:proton antiporter [Candidatus Binatia bacterium]
MPHSVPLITTIASALGLALVLGFVAVRLRLPALVGYLLAGILIGPSTPGFVADVELAGQLAEIGVILLMFGVGLHFSLEDLMSVRKVALPGAVVQIVVATAMGAGLAMSWGWSMRGALIFGLALSVASTVVLLKALEHRGALESANGRIAVGWLIVEDLVMVVVLVLLPALSHVGGAATHAAPAGGNLMLTLLATLGEVAFFVAFMLIFGRRLFPWLLWQVASTGSRELFTLCVIAVALGIAYASAALFGVSFALGAFFAGMVLQESELSYRAAEESLPLRDAFAVLFFVAVGMLFDPRVLLAEPWKVAAVLMVIVLGKSMAAFALVVAMRYPLNTAVTVSASLAQIGEFSFILAGLGVSLELLPEEGHDLILAGALLSTALNPLLFAAIEPVQTWLRSRSALARMLERPVDPLAELPETVESGHVTGHVVLVGHGRIGSRIAAALRAGGARFVVAEQDRELVDQLRRDGVHAVAGNYDDDMLILQAHVARASTLVISIVDTVSIRRMLEVARTLNPGIHAIVHARSAEEAERLRSEKGTKIFFADDEVAEAMMREALGAATGRERPDRP